MTVHDTLPLPFKSPGSPILVWKWDQAPEALRDLSTHGGDEDWVAAVPQAMENEWIPWMDAGGPFGYCHVDRIVAKIDGYIIVIGTHA